MSSENEWKAGGESYIFKNGKVYKINKATFAQEYINITASDLEDAKEKVSNR
jgi:hypothetical protein